MAYYTRKTVVLAQLETEYGGGTDGVEYTGTDVTVANDAIACSSLTFSPYEGDSLERNIVRPYLGASTTVSGTRYAKLDLEVELAGYDGVDLAPRWDRLLQACGMAKGTLATHSYPYTPVSEVASQKSLTLWFYADGTLHKMKGARGTCSLSLDPGQIPRLKFSFTGLLYGAGAITTASPGSYPAFTNWREPLVVNDTNTSFSIYGQTLTLNNLSADLGNSVTMRDVVGEQAVVITDRKSTLSAQVDAPPLGTINLFDKVSNGTGTLLVTHSIGNGNTFTLTANIHLTAIKYADANGIQALDLTLSAVPTSDGNDEISIDIGVDSV